MKRLLAYIAAVLAALTVMAPVLSAAELFSVPVGADEADGLDFSTPYSPRAYISPSDLLSMLLSDSLSTAEAEYLDGYYGEYLSYASALPASLVSLESGAEGIKINASEYSYEANNGQTVTYIPVYAMSGDTRYELVWEGDTYTALAEDKNGRISVYYNGSLTLSPQAVNRLLNFTYNEGREAMSSSAYLAEYHKALTEYETYLTLLAKYENALGEYEAYLSAKALYDRALAQYEKNCEDIRTYPDRLSKYEEFKTASEKYTADMEIYKGEYAAYERASGEYFAYITNLGDIRGAMSPMESLFIKPEKTGTLFRALQNGEMVEMIEKYKGLLVSGFGVAEEDITYMRKYSDELNALLRGYSEARELSEEEAFAYYKANYGRISSLFNSLYDKMSTIITPTIFNLICKKMELEYGTEFGNYRKWRIKNVLCHIYLICLCLDDTQTADGVWRFYEDDGDPCEYHFSDLLEQSLIITDTNASNPSALAWMAKTEQPAAPIMPTPPETVDRPVEPMEQKKPTEPSPVAKPTPPVEVSQPIQPEGFDPELLLRAGDIVELIDRENPALTEREEFAEPVDVPVELSVECLVSPTEKITVYGREGELIGEVDDIFSLPIPEAECTDGRRHYTFDEVWSLSPLEYVPLPDNIDGKISVYPLYTSSREQYTVTFSVNGVEVSEKYYVGELPSADGIETDKPSDSMYDYSFSGWNKAIRRVDGDVTYTAEYIQTDRIFTVSFVMYGRTVVEKYVRGSEIVAPEPAPYYIERASIFELTGWDKPLSAVSEDAVYTAAYRETVLAQGVSAAVSQDMSEYILEGRGRSFELSGLLSLSADRETGMKICFSDYGVTLTLSSSAVGSLQAKGAENIELIGTADEGFGFVFTDREGNEAVPAGAMRLGIPHGYDSDSHIYVRAYYKNGLYTDNVAVSCEEGICYLTPQSEVKYRTGRKFSLTVKSEGCGSAFCDRTLFSEGEELDIYIYPNSEYTVGKITLKNSESGEAVELSSVSGLTMPSYNAELLVEFCPVIYRITFEYEGRTDTYSYLLGEEPQVPKISLSFIKDGYLHTFIGWSSPVSIVGGDALYRAKYYSELYVEKPIEDEKSLGDIFGAYILPALGVVLGVGGAVCTTLLASKKKKPVGRQGRLGKK